MSSRRSTCNGECASCSGLLDARDLDSWFAPCRGPPCLDPGREPLDRTGDSGIWVRTPCCCNSSSVWLDEDSLSSGLSTGLVGPCDEGESCRAALGGEREAFGEQGRPTRAERGAIGWELMTGGCHVGILVGDDDDCGVRRDGEITVDSARMSGGGSEGQDLPTVVASPGSA
mmetsp:Transcript_23216/g.53422  ORF Transcript_23216/g.53422 Transcript_23216/m.53422 type:complete len:172 (+) Transcript_23216:784-1299(+)